MEDIIAQMEKRGSDDAQSDKEPLEYYHERIDEIVQAGVNDRGYGLRSGHDGSVHLSSTEVPTASPVSLHLNNCPRERSDDPIHNPSYKRHHCNLRSQVPYVLPAPLTRCRHTVGTGKAGAFTVLLTPKPLSEQFSRVWLA